MVLLVLIALQDSVLTEDFDRDILRDGAYPGWERVSDASHPRYNTVEIVDGAVRLRTLGGAAALRHRGRDADPKLSYRLAAAVRLDSVRANRATIALRWLDRYGRELRTDAGDGDLRVETPPADAARVHVELRLDGPDARSEARFDAVRLTAITRVELRPVGRTWPVFGTRESVSISVIPAADWALTGRLFDADGGLVRTMTSARGALTTDPLAPGAYRLEAGASPPGAPGVTKELWIYVLGAPLFDPPDPSLGLLFAREVADPAAIADVAGARHVAVAFPAAEPLVAAHARRPDTLITAVATPSRDQQRKYLQEIDRWDAKVAALRAPTVEDALRLGIAQPRALFEADAPSPALFALRTLNDLLSGAKPGHPPVWARGARTFAKRGRTIVALTNLEVTPPAGWLVVDPLRGRRAADGAVVAGARTLFLVSP
jgi:hypothetical protein